MIGQKKDQENLANFFQRLFEVTDGRFFKDEIQVNNQFTKQSFAGFAEVVKLVNDFQKTTKSLGDSRTIVFPRSSLHSLGPLFPFLPAVGK